MRALWGAWIWGGAIALCATVIAAVLWVVPAEEPPDMAAGIAGLAEAKLVFVGSSLTRYGIPQVASAEGLLKDGRRHARLTMSRITEKQSTELLRAAIGAGDASQATKRFVFVELYPYLRTFRDERLYGWTWGFAGAWDDRLRRFGRRIRGIKEALLGEVRQRSMKAKATVPDIVGTALSYDGSRKGFESVYPEEIHQPRDHDGLSRALREARLRGVTVVFVVLPRSQTVLGHLGREAAVSFGDAVTALEKRYAVEVWSPAASWSDEHFKDRAHMNALGRARFIGELRARFGGPDERN